jgi:hypothetical protein
MKPIDHEMKTVRGNGVQRVAQAPATVEQRVCRLRELAEQVTGRYLDLAVVLHQEHEAELWTKALAQKGGAYRSEEEFWEEAIGVKRRSAYQMIAIGRVLCKIGVRPDDTKALVGVGLYKMDLLVPVLEREPTPAALER